MHPPSIEPNSRFTPRSSEPQPLATESLVLGSRSRPVSPSFTTRSLAATIDFATILCALFLTIDYLHLSPMPSLSWGAVVLIEGIALILIEGLLLRRTLGELCWGIRREAGMLVGRSESLGGLSIGSFLTVSTWIASGLLTSHFLESKVELAQAPEKTLNAFLPPLTRTAADSLEIQWLVTPFFYSLGAWPRSYHGKPVFYEIPYAHGPPNHFVGQIIARWQLPDLKLTFEGPKTPRMGAEPLNREWLKGCLTADLIHLPSGIGFRECLKARDTSLERPLREMRKKISGAHLNLIWLSIANDAIPAQERVQGLYVSAENDAYFEDRFILLTPKGAQQAFILDGPVNEEGQTGRSIFLEAIRSLRVSDQLESARAWVDHELSRVQLSEVFSKNSLELSEIARVQGLLVSKISTDPSTFETYYHLGGTALLLLKNASSHQDGTAEMDWSASAKPLIQSAYRFAQDISPENPKTLELQGFWAQAQKR